MYLARGCGAGLLRWLVVVGLLTPLVGWAQAGAGEATPGAGAAAMAAEPAFVAVTIKPSNVASPGFFLLLRDDSDVYMMRNVPLMVVALQAYLGTSTVDRGRIKDAPAWAMTDRYDVQIKLDDAAMAAWKGLSRNEKIAKMAPLLRQMLAERCKLQAHTAPVQVDGFVLELDKGGAKMTPTPADGSYPEAVAKELESMPGMNTIGHGGKIVFPSGEGGAGFIRGTMDDVADYIRLYGIATSNQTGLKGTYDLFIPVDPDPVEPGAPPPDLFRSRPEQFTRWHWEAVGLKLRQAKVTAQQVVVDHMERPSGN